MNIINEKSEDIIPEYYYRLRECGTRFIADGLPPEAIRVDLDFRCEDLLESKDAAEERYWKRILTANPASKLMLILVEEWVQKNLVEEYFLHGKDTQIISEGREYESRVLKAKGYKQDTKHVSC